MHGDQVHRLAQLMDIDEGADHNQGTEDVPAPEGACAKAVAHATALKLIADPGADTMVPHNGGDAAGQPGEDEQQQAVMHSFLAVVTAGGGVDIGADAEHLNDGVNAKGNGTQQDEFQQTSVGLQLADGGERNCFP